MKIYDWTQIKAEYINRSLQATETPIYYFTNKYGMKYQTFMGKKKAQGWDKDLRKQRKILERQTLKKVKTRLSTLDAEDVLDEIKVRKKNMKIANTVLKTLLEEWEVKIQSKKERKKLGLASIISGLETVSRLRGKAAGLPEKLDINSKNLNLNVDADSTLLSPAENRKKVQEAEELAQSLKEILKEMQVIDVKPIRLKKPKAKEITEG